ncbi:MAG: hypothetical protein ACLT9S_00090 [Faecalibacterium sp.]
MCRSWCATARTLLISNDELAAMYAAEYRDYESYPQAEVSQDEWCPETYINWDAYWYGDCVSL